MAQDFDSKRAWKLYLELRKYRTKDGNLALEYVYNLHKEELNANRIDFSGFFHIMGVAHTFWTSRGEDTRRDRGNETYTIV